MRYFIWVGALLLGLAIVNTTYAASAKLTWQDNSGIVSPTNCSTTATSCDQEEGFNIYRNLNSGPFAIIGTSGRDVATYTDGTLQSSFTAVNQYCYKITAFNHGTAVPPATIGPLQESASSNIACVSIPVITNAVPAAPTGLGAQ